MLVPNVMPKAVRLNIVYLDVAVQIAGLSQNARLQANNPLALDSLLYGRGLVKRCLAIVLIPFVYAGSG